MSPAGAMARAVLVGAALAGAALAAPGVADAQPVEVTVNRDGAPESGVSIFSFVNGIKRRSGTTGSDGMATVDPAALGAEPGDTVDVVRTCTDGRVEIVLVRRGEEGDPCADQEAEAHQECECRRIGAFVVGDGPVTVDVGRGVVIQSPASGSSLQFGAGFKALYFERFGDVANDQPGLVSGDAGSWGWSPYATIGYDIDRFPVDLGLQVGYGRAPDVDQTYSGGSAEIRTDFLYVTPFVEVAPTDVWDLDLGVEWIYNRISIEQLPISDVFLDDIDRNEANFNGYFGLGYRRRVGSGLSLGGGVSYSTNFSGNDADSGILGLWLEARTGGGL